MTSLHQQTIRFLLTSAVLLAGIACEPVLEDGHQHAFDREIAAVGDDTPCAEVDLLVEEAAQRDAGAVDAIAAEAEACSSCVCDLVDLHKQCEALAPCGKNSRAHAVKGNTCSAKRCDSSSPCGGKIVCKKGGVECGVLGDDLGTCEWQ